MRGTSTMGPSVDQPATSVLHWPSLRGVVLPGGLHLNRAKSLLHIPVGDPLNHNPLPADIPSTRGRFDFLGSPIGPASHCESTVLKRVKKVQEILAKLGDLQDSQMETTLLRSCLALPKVAFAKPRPTGHCGFRQRLVGGPVGPCWWAPPGMGLAEGLPPKLSRRAEHQTGLFTCSSSIHQLPGSVKAARCQDPGACTGGLPTPGSCPFGPGHCC